MPFNKRPMKKRPGFRRKKYAGRRRAPMRRRNKTGYAKIIRKVQPIFVQNSAAGAATLYAQDTTTGTVGTYTGGAVNLGTPGVGISGAYDVPFSMKFTFPNVAHVGCTSIPFITSVFGRFSTQYIPHIPVSGIACK